MTSGRARHINLRYVLAGMLQRPILLVGHCGDVITGPMAYQIISIAIVYSTVHSDTDQRKHQSSASLAFVRRIHRCPVNSPHKRPVTRKMFPFDDIIMSEGSPPVSTSAATTLKYSCRLEATLATILWTIILAPHLEVDSL